MILWITSIFVLLVFISNLNSHNISPFFTQLHVHIYLHDMAEYISHTINVTPQRDTDGHNVFRHGVQSITLSDRNTTTNGIKHIKIVLCNTHKYEINGCLLKNRHICYIQIYKNTCNRLQFTNTHIMILH